MQEGQKRELVRVTFVGDLMCKREQLAVIRQGQRTWDEIFDFTRCLFEDSDIVIGNLETPLAGKACEYTKYPLYFNTPDDFAVAIKRAGIGFVTTANNHCMDRGVAGLNATIDALDRAGLAHTGTYKTKAESDEIKVVDVAGIKLALVTATYGINSEVVRPYIHREQLPDEEGWRIDLLKRPARPSHKAKIKVSLTQVLKKRAISVSRRIRNALLTLMGVPVGKPKTNDYLSDNVPPQEIGNPIHEQWLNRYLDKIKRAHEVADVVIALPHVGGQYNPTPGVYQHYITDRIVAAGADLVIENHSHNPLPTVNYPNGVFVAYSLGNFCFTPYVDSFVPQSFGEYGVVLDVWFDRQTKCQVKRKFTLVKNVVGGDGFSYPVPVEKLFDQYGNDVEKRQRLKQDVDLVMLKLTGRCGEFPCGGELERAVP